MAVVWFVLWWSVSRDTPSQQSGTQSDRQAQERQTSASGMYRCTYDSKIANVSFSIEPIVTQGAIQKWYLKCTHSRKHTISSSPTALNALRPRVLRAMLMLCPVYLGSVRMSVWIQQIRVNTCAGKQLSAGIPPRDSYKCTSKPTFGKKNGLQRTNLPFASV